MGPSGQTLPLEKCSVFVGEEKQTSDPKEAIKQMVGRDAAREYYASRPTQKGDMKKEVFDTMAWDDVEETLKERSKMFKMRYAKQGWGYCGMGYWTSKWETTDKTTKRRS